MGYHQLKSAENSRPSQHHPALHLTLQEASQDVDNLVLILNS